MKFDLCSVIFTLKFKFFNFVADFVNFEENTPDLPGLLILLQRVWSSNEDPETGQVPVCWARADLYIPAIDEISPR